jgi:hypothetical protein
VFLQHSVEVFDLDLQWGSRKPKEQDAGVGKSVTEDQLSEIAVGNQQNPLLFLCNGKGILISQTGRVVARNVCVIPPPPSCSGPRRPCGF